MSLVDRRKRVQKEIDDAREDYEKVGGFAARVRVRGLEKIRERIDIALAKKGFNPDGKPLTGVG